jgi:beta-galactosidase
MYFGVDYYPEHVDSAAWIEDARLMDEMGVNVVRLAEFAWAKLEPEKDRFEFAWLDGVIALMAQHGIRVVLGTPTAAPPKWLVERYPDMLQADRMGRARGFGGRRHGCMNHEGFRSRAAVIADKIAEHYAANPNVIAWQVDNEFGGHDTTRCYCESCLLKFRRWLENRYGTVENLNKHWGTIVWSQTLDGFDKVDFVMNAPCYDTDEVSHGYNPARNLDFLRFSSDSVAEFQGLQVKAIRARCTQPVTHNFMGHFPDIDYFNLANELDFVSLDNYPNSMWGGSWQGTAMALDLTRGLKGKPFWVMEQQSGPAGWSRIGDAPKPGQLRLWTWQAVAHGAQAVLYFAWRGCPIGPEQFWYGILDHDNIPRRRYFELRQTGAELRQISGLLTEARAVPQIAIVKSYDCLWSFANQPMTQGFDYTALLQSYYDGAIASGFNVDVVSAEADLSAYSLVLLPAYSLLPEAFAQRLGDYVQQGGTLLITFHTGIRNMDNSMSALTKPGLLAKAAGVVVEEFDSMNFGRTVGVKTRWGEGVAHLWCDVLKLTTAESAAEYASEFYCGEPAVAVNRYGQGRVYTVGCDLDGASMKALLAAVAAEAGAVPAVQGLPEGVEARQLRTAEGPLVILLNHTGGNSAVPLEGRWVDRFTGVPVAQWVELEPYGVAVLTRPV